MTKIVVTGAGIITSMGAGKDANLRHLKSGLRAIGPIRNMHTRHCELPVGEVSFSDEELKKMLGYDLSAKITRTSLLGCAAVREALDEAGLRSGCNARAAFISGNTVGGMEKSERFYLDFLHNDDKNDYIALHDCGACTDIIAHEYGGHFEMVTTISTACSSAANAVILGANLIRDGHADIAVVGGTECLSKFHLNGFNTLMILDPEPCRPFDAKRHGLNLGEGAAYLVLESEESAQQRKATPLCELSGYGNACDAFHQTATSPNGEGAYLAMKEALEMSGLAVNDIDYINAHGTGTGNNDECEGIAMMRLFGETMPPVSSTKSYTGHTTSAAGGVESVISILALIHGFIPANIGYEHPIEQHSFRPVDHVVEDVQLTHVLTNSFGFGGNDSSCIFSRVGTAHAFQGADKCRIFVQGAAHISMQQPLGEDWFDNPIAPNAIFNEAVEPNYQEYFAPMVARRMGKLLKRAVVTSVNAIGEHPLPDAIITGTGLGCIDNTERFLKAMIENDEQFLQPTFFMQSTHNTISSQVALHLQCHGYNCTYSHRGTSFDSALMDAIIQMRLGDIHSALVGAHDEMTPAYFDMLAKIGYWKREDARLATLRAATTTGSLAGNCSASLLLSNEREKETLCAVSGMEMLYHPTTEQLNIALQHLLDNAGITIGDISAIVSSLNGDCHNDRVCHHFAHLCCPGVPEVWYKHLFGESFSASAFGLYVGAICLKKNRIPTHLLYSQVAEISNPKYLLVYNHFKDIDHSLILLSK